MSIFAERRFTALAPIFGGIVGLVFIALVLRYDHDLRSVIRQKMIDRDAAVLTSVAQQEIETGATGPESPDPAPWLAALLPAAHRQGVLAMAIFDADGILLEKIPSSQLLVELPADDFASLQNGQPITHYWPTFSLASFLLGGPSEPTPVLELILPLHQRPQNADKNAAGGLIGFVRYHLDARALAAELETLDGNVRRQTIATLAVGLVALTLLMSLATFLLSRAQQTIDERTAKLQRANFELTLAAKTSALGEITSHLIHGLQGPVAGLRALMADRYVGDAGKNWGAAADYTERMQAMIQDTVALLGDAAAQTSYELTGHELATIVGRRNRDGARNKNIALQVQGGFDRNIDSHRGGVLCLITNNLVENAIDATPMGRAVTVEFAADSINATVSVADEGTGIPETILPHLFEPGHSGRAGGSGLGLAISQLLARQIGASLVLQSTGPKGTIFRLSLPFDPS